MSEKTKEELFKEWIKFKKAEDKAKDNRTSVESDIENLYKFKEKSKTFKEEDLGYSVNLKKNLGVKMDQEKWNGIRESIDSKVRPEKITYSLNMEGFEWLKKNNPEVYKLVSDCVEIKPNKTTIKVEKLK